MKLFRDSGNIARAVLGAALLAFGAVTARAQNYPVYDIVVPLGSTSDLTVIDGTSRILPTNRSFVIGLAGGTRGCIEIRNFTATPEYPLIIVNQHGTGKVVITDVGGATRRKGISIVNCQYFQLRGDNDPAFRYGIEVAQVGSKAGLAQEGINLRGTTSDGEIAFVEVHDSGFAGIMAKSDVNCNEPEMWAANYVMRNMNVHDNYIHHTGGEGM